MPTVAEKLEQARQELLDLSARNRLLNIPSKSSSRIIHIHDERTKDIFRLLHEERKGLTFKAAKQARAPNDSNPTPGTTSISQDDASIEKRYLDGKLQTDLASENLQRRLLQMFYDARTFIEEQGINLLFITFGQLKWFEDETSDVPRFAPLILLPVTLERRTARERFFLKTLEEDPAENISLSAKLRRDFGIVLPDFDTEAEFDPNSYLAAVAEIAGGKNRWEVLPNAIAVGFFSFSRFLMYRDLDAENWPKENAIDQHSIVAALLENGFSTDPSIIGDESPNIDELLPPSRCTHVLDADSSQAVAIEKARHSNHLVIHGPPGTGKSQTIANIVATAVLDGRSVLFVAEKLAALEVVKRRLDSIHLGAMCLELHSQKANKRNVLEDLKATLSIAAPSTLNGEAVNKTLGKLRTHLNEHASVMHTRISPSNLTPFTIIGHVVELSDKLASDDLPMLEQPESWDQADGKERSDAISDLILRIGELGLPSNNVWRGVRRDTVIRSDLNRIQQKVSRAESSMEQLSGLIGQISKSLSIDLPKTFDEF